MSFCTLFFFFFFSHYFLSHPFFVICIHLCRAGCQFGPGGPSPFPLYSVILKHVELRLLFSLLTNVNVWWRLLIVRAKPKSLFHRLGDRALWWWLFWGENACYSLFLASENSYWKLIEADQIMPDVGSPDIVLCSDAVVALKISIIYTTEWEQSSPISVNVLFLGAFYLNPFKA